MDGPDPDFGVMAGILIATSSVAYLVMLIIGIIIGISTR